MRRESPAAVLQAWQEATAALRASRRIAMHLCSPSDARAGSPTSVVPPSRVRRTSGQVS